MAGGYLAGRMRRRTGDATADEFDTRDGANGLTVWAVATLIGAVLATTGVSTVTRGAGAAVGTVTQAAGSAAGGAAGALGGELDYFAGLVQRGEGTALGNPEVRGEIATILGRSLREGEVSPGRPRLHGEPRRRRDRDAARRGRRPGRQALGQFEQAKQAAIDAAEAARIAGIVSGFVIAATLFAAAAAAYLAAVTGGNHRDENVAFRTLR